MQSRIERAGGRVDRSAGGRSLRLNGHIAMSRTMGDSDFKSKGLLVCTPDIFHRDVKPGDEQIVLATVRKTLVFGLGALVQHGSFFGVWGVGVDGCQAR